MKTTAFIPGMVALIITGSIIMTSCGQGQQHKEEKTKYAEKHERQEEEAEAKEHHDHFQDEHPDSGHMQHMIETREWLKKELGDKYDQPVPPATGEQLARGKNIYTKICAVCHGEGGKGDGPAAVAFKQKPADFTNPVHSRYYSDQGRIFIIKKGIPNTPMVGWEGKLDEKEIQSVYAYIRSLRSSEEAGEHEDNSQAH